MLGFPVKIKLSIRYQKLLELYKTLLDTLAEVIDRDIIFELFLIIPLKNIMNIILKNAL